MDPTAEIEALKQRVAALELAVQQLYHWHHTTPSQLPLPQLGINVGPGGLSVAAKL